MAATKTVAVTGASGFVGRHVVSELLRRGHRVRALARGEETAREALPVADPAVHVTYGDAQDATVLEGLVAGADACIHLVGIIRERRGESRERPQTFERVHVGMTRAVVKACARGGVRRYVHMSALGASPDGAAEYQRTKFEGEVVVRESGLAWTIFRPSVIHGAESEFVNMIADIASSQHMPWYFIPYFSRKVVDMSVPLGPSRMEPAKVQPVFVDDVAWCFAEALERGVTEGEVYNIAGAEVMEWPDVLRALRDELPGANHRLPISPVPATAGLATVRVARALGLGGVLPFDEGQVVMSVADSVTELAKAREHLGFRPRPFRETLRSYAPSVL